MRNLVARLRHEQRARLRTTRGRVAAGVTIAVLALVFAADPVPAQLAVVVLAAVPVWFAAWPAADRIVEASEQLLFGGPPDASVGRAWSSSSSRQQLREDTNAYFFSARGGVLRRKRDWFVATGTPPLLVEPGAYARWIEDAETMPQQVAAFRDRLYWLSDGRIYWTNRPELEAEDVRVLLFARERKRQREVDHAHAVFAAQNDPEKRARREPIPLEVRRTVFERDGGKCQDCGASFDIQYDHVIPLALGGSNAANNLQLLCGRCNQQKGARL